MESGGDCATQALTMFSTLQSVSKSELATLKSNNADYTALLNTAHGRAFENDVGNSSIIKLYATLAGSGDSYSIPTPTATPTSAARSVVDPTPTPVSREGVNCLYSGETADTMSERIETLNCLVFDTPHSFWVTQSSKTKTGNDLAAASDNRYSFLGYGDWECSRSPDFAFKSGCLKHDVSYSLRTFVGPDILGSSWLDEDAVWNPRNKYLADLKFSTDILKDAERATIGPSLGCPFTSPNPTLTFTQGQEYLAYLSCRVYREIRASQFYVRAKVFEFGLIAYWDLLGWRRPSLRNGMCT